MLTIRFIDSRASETIQPGIERVSWHEGALTAALTAGGTVTFGPNYTEGTVPVAYVMNDNGATVAKYEFLPRDPVELERLAA